jgi:hypothetical protein
VLWWLAVYPIPSALTRGSHPDWLRAACGMGAPELTAAVGGAAALGWLRRLGRPGVARAAVAAFGVAVAVNAGIFLWDYTQHFPNRAAWAFTDGARAAVQRLAALEDGSTRVVLPAEVPAIHDIYLFYSGYDPHRLHAERLEDVAPPGAWADVRGFGNHRVCRPAECCGPGDLCLVRGAWTGGGTVLDTVQDRTGRVAFTIVRG